MMSSSPAVTPDDPHVAAAAASSANSIPHVSASSLSSAEFVERFVRTNQPIIIDGALDAWNQTLRTHASSSRTAAADAEPPSWNVSQLASLLGSTPVRNIFVSSAQNRRRFKFFKQKAATSGAKEAATAAGAAAAASSAASSSAASSTTAAAASTPADSQIDAGLSRLSLPFNDFIKLSFDAAAAEAADERPHYYLYGEPMPPPLLDFFPTLPILSAVASRLTSTLLWVSPAPTVSPMHFDLSEGILCQLEGSKRITLAAPQIHDELYPYPITHAHDRQSRVDDIHSPDPSRFPLACSVPMMDGLLSAGSLLYIPYGWWHQIESTSVSVSVSMRWNPYEAGLRQVAVGAQATRALPLPARQAIQQRLWEALDLPPIVREINERRWAELAQLRAECNTEAMLEASS